MITGYDSIYKALDWLYTHYWLNALSPPTFRQLVPLEPLIAQLTSYKSLMKASLRDASTSSKNKADFSKLYRSIDAWVAEAEGEGRGRERAIEGLVEAFIIDGGLVPTAKKYVDSSFHFIDECFILMNVWISSV